MEGAALSFAFGVTFSCPPTDWALPFGAGSRSGWRAKALPGRDLPPPAGEGALPALAVGVTERFSTYCFSRLFMARACRALQASPRLPSACSARGGAWGHSGIALLTLGSALGQL